MKPITEKSQRIIDLRREEQSYEDICRLLGCTMKSVRYVVAKYHVAYQDIENAWKSEVESLRKSGLDYIDVSNRLGVPKDTIELYCRGHNLGYGDLGDSMKKEHHGSLLLKNRVFIDWNDKITKCTDGAFEFVKCSDSEGVGERRLIIKCKQCGNEKNISSITTRGNKKIICTVCTGRTQKTKEERLAEKIALERAKQKKKLEQKRNKIFQMQMNFCECGKLLPFDVKRCDKCEKEYRRIKAKQWRESERGRESVRRSRSIKDHKRRVREQSYPFDKTISLDSLFKRDYGICYICCKPCDWSDFQKVNGAFVVGGSYPTIEHVKPLCKGGTHTWNNVKLACHACNSKKGRKYSPPGRSN